MLLHNTMIIIQNNILAVKHIINIILQWLDNFFFRQGLTSQPIWHTNLPCSSSDSCINHCRSCPSRTASSCSHFQEISVSCGKWVICFFMAIVFCVQTAILQLLVQFIAHTIELSTLHVEFEIQVCYIKPYYFERLILSDFLQFHQAEE